MRVHNALHFHHSQSSIHFSEGFPQDIPGSEGCLYTSWPARSADPLADHLDVWQEHSSLGCHSEKHFASFSAPLQLLIWGRHSPLGHSGHGSFPLPGQDPVCKPVQLCYVGSLLYQISLSGCEWASCKCFLPSSHGSRGQE